MPALPFPALYLYPLNHTFSPKHIALQHNEHVKIGRQTNSKTIPAERNGFFDSKVLSRQHAEIWLENGQASPAGSILDTTLIAALDLHYGCKEFKRNIHQRRTPRYGIRRIRPSHPQKRRYRSTSTSCSLSPLANLHQEFGIDIVGEDNKTVLHHKVAARVICALTEKDAQDAARTEHIYQAQLSPNGSNAGTSPTAFNFGPPRRPMGQQQGGPPQQPSQQQQLMGGMAGSMRAPGRGALSFDHILSRLQGEVQKSRETGSDLNTVNMLMSTVQNTLGGSLVRAAVLCLFVC